MCTKCKKEKEVEFFDNCKKNKLCPYRAHCKQCRKEERENKEYKDKHAEFNREYYYTKYKTYHDKFYQDNKKIINQRMLDYAKLPKVIERKKQRRINDLDFKIKCWMRGTLHRCLSGGIKNGRTANLLGYTSKEMVDKFGSDIKYFKEQNIKYHIDHKIPLKWFITNTPIKILSSLDNLQILSATQNNIKSFSYADPVIEQYALEAIDFIKDEYKNQILII